jgi:hypothetical protein
MTCRLAKMPNQKSTNLPEQAWVRFQHSRQRLKGTRPDIGRMFGGVGGALDYCHEECQAARGQRSARMPHNET